MEFVYSSGIFHRASSSAFSIYCEQLFGYVTCSEWLYVHLSLKINTSLLNLISSSQVVLVYRLSIELCYSLHEML